MASTPGEMSAGLPGSLIDIAAGRPVASFDAAEDVLDAAIEHRMTGLLADRVVSGELSGTADWNRRVTAHLLAHRQRSIELTEATLETIDRLAGADVDAVVLKGVTVEHRWYPAPGTRPADDVDVLVAPRDRTRAREIAQLLDPEWGGPDHLDELVAAGHVQSITLRCPSDLDIDLDVHFDLCKLGVPSRHPADLWAHRETIPVGEGAMLPALDTELSLVHLLVHLNKDRFTHLRGYADIARILIAGDVDWTAVATIVESEGLEVPVAATLWAVVDTLGLAPVPIARPQGARARFWHRLWPPDSRLQGDPGSLRSTRRWFWLPFLLDDGGTAGARWWLRHLVPPPGAVDINMPEASGPYIARLVRGRREHRRSQADIRRRLEDAGEQ